MSHPRRLAIPSSRARDAGPSGVRQGWLRHSAAVKRTAKEGEPNGRNTGEGDGAGGLVGAPPRSWRRQVRRRATCATLLGEAEAAGGELAATGRALELLARELNVTAARLSQWRDRALLAAEAALKE